MAKRSSKTKKAKAKSERKTEKAPDKDVSSIPINPVTGKPLHPEFISHMWKPGQSGNPSGRAKGPGITALRQKDALRPAKDVPYAEKLCRELGLDPEASTIGDLAAAAANYHSIMGVVGYYKENLERDEGKVPDVLLENPLSALFDLSDDQLEALEGMFPDDGKKKKRGRR